METRTEKARYKADLIKQQNLCERNFHKLMLLLPDLEEKDNVVLSFYFAGKEGQALFQVLERAPFTTVLQVDLDAAWSEWLKLPEFRIRIYLDVRMAEIISVNKERHFKAIYPYPNEKMLMPDEKEQLNQLFSEWLNFCLTHGLSQI
ncbi:DUF1249 domain-containing protein [Endozoicomonas sp. 8E]|uniref:DUF1249 domain-containing protein n=1 Tax=Endozoicomonas sp. 8E TaxID=3035692 RepID=UPI00293935CF|nr:DUF1249 domain-containing protein [Endozoicomonas sp. 8E]WOG26705.1 DUF1249 domain-containing protein [Endozoicomonas sp. 8E]